MVFHRLIRACALALACLAVPAHANTPAEVQRMVIEEATSRGVPPSLALAVARVESNFEAMALSPVGARGVMQLMPKTARDVFGVRENELWNARLNIKLGIDFLAQLYAQYGNRWDLALSHYNGGTLRGGSGAFAQPHDYTRKYVADVMRWQRTYAQGLPAPPRTTTYKSARRDDRPWRSDNTTTRRPWQRIDPLDFDDWARRRGSIGTFGREG